MEKQGPYDKLEQVFSPISFNLEGIVLDSDTWKKLDVIAQAKNFALMIGLKPSPNYMRLRKAEDALTLYSLCAAPKTEMPERIDDYFFIEEGQTLDKICEKGVRVASFTDTLEEIEKLYESSGFDVHRRLNHNFYPSSGAGCDITPELLNDMFHEQIRVVLHEDWHHTYQQWHPGKPLCGAINEVAAQIISYAGALEFGRLVGHPKSEYCRQSEKAYERLKTRAHAFNRTYDALQKLYTTALTDAQKLHKRKSLLKRVKKMGYGDNNASIMDMRPYTKHLPLFAEAYEELGSVKRFINLMRNCPIEEDKAVKFIRDFIDSEELDIVVELPVEE